MEHIREFTDDTAHVRLDLSEQVLGLDIPEEQRELSQDDLISPTFPRHGSDEFVSAAAMAFKAKQFDDGLYAAIEIAAQNGAGVYPGKEFLLTSLIKKLTEAASANATEPLSVLCAACSFTGLNVAVPQFAESAVSKTIAEFLKDQLSSKPISFYSGNPELEAIFKQDRMLQTPLQGKEGIKAVVEALNIDSQLRTTYQTYLNLIERLTNPWTVPDFRSLCGEGGTSTKQVFPDEVFFFPASRSHETDLIKKLFGNRPIPDGFNLMDEVIARIRSGALELKPKKDSGWYDYQIWSIEPLAVPERTREANRLQLDESYSKHLFELFKGIYALTRETHIKQLELPRLMGAPPSSTFTIRIIPDLSAEPLATFYLRRALSYRFLREVLTATFGVDALDRLRRVTAKGRSNVSLAEELDDIETLFFGAHVIVTRQMGMAPADISELGSLKGSDACATTFRDWIRHVGKDEDLRQDARMMVPLFYDEGRGRIKMWLFLGWTIKPLRVYFANPPRVLAYTYPDGRPFGKYATVNVLFSETHRNLESPVSAEIYVKKLLNRDEFRRHCDTYKTPSEIVNNLH